jgi:hypothetical protein
MQQKSPRRAIRWSLCSYGFPHLCDNAQELAPCYKTGCCGFTGPTPPPLLIRQTVFNSTYYTHSARCSSRGREMSAGSPLGERFSRGHLPPHPGWGQSREFFGKRFSRGLPSPHPGWGRGAVPRPLRMEGISLFRSRFSCSAVGIHVTTSRKNWKQLHSIGGTGACPRLRRSRKKIPLPWGRS